jgi:hypothetical protein
VIAISSSSIIHYPASDEFADKRRLVGAAAF